MLFCTNGQDLQVHVFTTVHIIQDYLNLWSVFNTAVYDLIMLCTSFSLENSKSNSEQKYSTALLIYPSSSRNFVKKGTSVFNYANKNLIGTTPIQELFSQLLYTHTSLNTHLQESQIPFCETAV